MSDSPLALPFEEALQPSAFLTQLRSAAENEARRELASIANDALKSVLASGKFVLDRNGMHVVFEGGIPKGAKLMRDIAGKALPTLVDGKTGKTLKVARGVASSRKVVSATAGAALVIVEAAHMISGYDNAQRLKNVEGRVTALWHAHQSELKLRLKAIYRHCKELIGGDLNQISALDQRVLHGKCQDLMELRSRWQDDFRHRLNQIKTAEPGLMNRILWWRKEEGHKKDREEKAKDAVDALEIVQLMHFSLMLQMSLAGASGHMESFRSVTLRDECHSWSELMEFTSKRAKDICGNSEAQEFKPFIEAIADLVAFWSPDCWEFERSGTVLEKGENQSRMDAIARKPGECDSKARGSLIVMPCPFCEQALRVPGDRGKLNVTYPSCKGRFAFEPGKD